MATPLPPVIKEMVTKGRTGARPATGFFMTEKEEFGEGSRELFKKDNIFLDKRNDFGPFLFGMRNNNKTGPAVNLFFLDTQQFMRTD